MFTTMLIAQATNIQVGTDITHKFFGITFDVDILGSTILAGVILLGLGFYLRKKATNKVPGKLQLLFEVVIEAVQNQVSSSIGPEGASVVPLAITLFFFILIANWIEIIPTGIHPEYLPAPTGNVNLTYALAFFVIILVHIASVRKLGIKGYTQHYFKPASLPIIGRLAMFPVNLIEEIAKPFTLALRLFGNLFAGGLMVLLIATLFMPVIVVPVDILWKLFDMFIGLIQAFIFALLTILYFEMAMSESH